MTTGVNQEIVVAVVSHKPYRMPADSVYMPLHVGAALHPDVLPDWVQDNEGENISDRNGKYSELTGLYWLWKNCDADYIGLVHYRRHFATRSWLGRRARDRFDRIIGGEELAQVLQKADVVVPNHRNYVIETVRSHYEHTLPAEHLDVTRDVIQERCPQYLAAFDKVMGGTKAHMFNMFIMRRDLLADYCDWLFPILFELEQRTDDSAYDAFNLRYPGRVSEMLLDVWLSEQLQQGVRMVELPVASPEPVDWPAKIMGFLNAKFRGKKYGKSF